MPPHKVNLRQAFATFDEAWHPRVAGEVNDMQVKLAKLEGEFMWHHHDDEDELFLVVHGVLRMRFRDRDITVEPGEFLIVPRGVEHLPIGERDCQVMLFEPKSTLNTGTVVNDRTVDPVALADAE
jgi:mannose-6-phosphate isomerase-like protein (cupin superfamily)